MPFRNLKFLIIINKALGLISCKLVNGRLKSSSMWSCCFCMLCFFYIIVNTSMYYYTLYLASPAEKVKNDFALSILRSSIYMVSLFPFNMVAAFWSENIVKLSDKFLTYDEHAIALGHRRKDKHICIYLFFVYILIVISWKFCFNISNILKGTQGILDMLQGVTLDIFGVFCVLVTFTFLDLTRQRFRHLNETIIPHVSELPITGLQNEITVYDVRYLHGVLFDSAELINRLYGIGTLITFLSILLELVWSVYNIIKDLQDDKDIIYDNIIYLSDVALQTIYLFAMYHFTTYEANRVEERVIKYGLPFSNKYRVDKIEMMLYFYHRRYSFTAAEFFPLDITILLPIITAVITYLTLIV